MTIFGLDLFNSAEELNQLVAGAVFTIFVGWALLTITWFRNACLLGLVIIAALLFISSGGFNGIVGAVVLLWSSLTANPAFLRGFVIGVAVVLFVYWLIKNGRGAQPFH